MKERMAASIIFNTPPSFDSHTTLSVTKNHIDETQSMKDDFFEK